MKVNYFDHAASSWPKPPAVAEAMQEAILHYGANPGRGAHQMAVKASRILFEARKNIGKLIGAKNPNDIAFALNTTHALNLAIKGYVKPGDHVICTSVEHNSVRRPLEYLKKNRNVQVTYVATNPYGVLDLARLKEAFQSNTTLIVCSHGSNLLGSILPIADIADITKKNGARLLVDGAQTLGAYPLHVTSMGIDMLAFPGHKGLMGPQGTGGLYVSSEVDLEPLMHGGTGSKSEDIDQPSVRPDRYEAGTQNTVGIAGLNEGVKFILNESVEKIHNKEWNLIQRMMEGLREIPGLLMLGPAKGEDRTGLLSFTMDGIDSSEAAFILDQSFQIAVRAGYHCTPLAHETAGTLTSGAIRASVGYYTTEEEVDYFIHAVKEIRQGFL